MSCRYIPLQNEILITLETGIAMGRQPSSARPIQGYLSWIVPLAQGHSTFIGQWYARVDPCRSIKVWLSHLGQLWMIISSSESPLSLAEASIETIAAHLLLLPTLASSLPLCSPPLLSLPSFPICCSQEFLLKKSLYIPSKSALLRTQPWQNRGNQWVKFPHPHFMNCCKSLGLPESTFFYSLIIHVKLNNV